MKLLFASDSFKGTLSSQQIIRLLKASAEKIFPGCETVGVPIADGGEGTVEAVITVTGGKYRQVKVHGPLMEETTASYGVFHGDRAVIEMAAASGLPMVPVEKRNPLETTTYGTGELIRDALEQGYRKIAVAIGGSATNDGGMGLLQSLGARFYDMNHKYLSPQAMNLEKIRYIDLNRLNKLEGIELIAACDVKNHLLGENGATYVFGKQKGFFPNQIKKVDMAMQNYRDQLYRYTHVDIDTFEGGGAAGGIGAVLIGILQAKMMPGIELLMSYSDIEDQIQDCDLVITGEGQSDRQTMYGKVPAGILKVAKKHDKPIICISGALGIGYMDLYELGFVGIYSIADRAMTFQQALENAPEKLELAAYGIMRTIWYFKNHS